DEKDAAYGQKTDDPVFSKTAPRPDGEDHHHQSDQGGNDPVTVFDHRLDRGVGGKDLPVAEGPRVSAAVFGACLGDQSAHEHDQVKTCGGRERKGPKPPHVTNPLCQSFHHLTTEVSSSGGNGSLRHKVDKNGPSAGDLLR